MDRGYLPDPSFFNLTVKNMFAAKSAIFLKLYFFRTFSLILRGTVIDTVTFRALQLYGFTHY